MDLPRLDDVEFDVLGVLDLDLLWSLCPGLMVFRGLNNDSIESIEISASG